MIITLIPSFSITNELKRQLKIIRIKSGLINTYYDKFNISL